ncbi:MAG: hypothetical protein RIC87_15765 [Kiloniellales bacterium]
MHQEGLVKLTIPILIDLNLANVCEAGLRTATAREGGSVDVAKTLLHAEILDEDRRRADRQGVVHHCRRSWCWCRHWQ